MKSKILKLFGLIFLSSCSYSINMVHTAGEATDVIDSAQTTQPDVSPTLTVPMQAL